MRDPGPPPFELYRQMDNDGLRMLYRALALDLEAVTTADGVRFCHHRMRAIDAELTRRGVEVPEV